MATDTPLMPPLLVDEREARRLLGNVSTKSLFNWRCHAGLPYVRLGKRVMYCPTDLLRWIEQRKEVGDEQL